MGWFSKKEPEQAPVPRNQRHDDMAQAAIVYAITFNNPPPDFGQLAQTPGLKPVLEQMAQKGLLSMYGSGGVGLGPKGLEYQKLLRRLVSVVRPFSIFRHMDMDELPANFDKLIDPQNGHVFNDMNDPRFSNESGGDDWRPAVLTFIGEMLKWEHPEVGQLDVVGAMFLLTLVSDGIGNDFWPRLGNGQAQSRVEQLVRNAEKWEDISPEGEEEDVDHMCGLYIAGLSEVVKRQGIKCTGCQIPLGMFDMNAQAGGSELTRCPDPNCKTPYAEYVPPSTDVECEYCNTRQPPSPKCNTCGAQLGNANTVAPERKVDQDWTDGDFRPHLINGHFALDPYDIGEGLRHDWPALALLVNPLP